MSSATLVLNEPLSGCSGRAWHPLGAVTFFLDPRDRDGRQETANETRRKAVKYCAVRQRKILHRTIRRSRLRGF
jgi:hypothetical protein